VGKHIAGYCLSVVVLALKSRHTLVRARESANDIERFGIQHFIQRGGVTPDSQFVLWLRERSAMGVRYACDLASRKLSINTEMRANHGPEARDLYTYAVGHIMRYLYTRATAIDSHRYHDILL
jgi:hypothetical protein